MKWIAVFLIAAAGTCVGAQDKDAKTELAKRDAKIAELEARLEHIEGHIHGDGGHDAHKEEGEPGETNKGDDDGHDHGDGGVRIRLLDLSLNIMTAVGTSTSTDEELEGVQLGNHDPRRRGFTLQQAEFAFAGAIEPFFAGEAYLVATEEVIELEEAFFRSLFSPYVELKGGYFFTEFGRINRLHPHSWRWIDQPVANARILGPEGMRGVGGRVATMIENPWHSKWIFAVQNADDASMVSFLGEGHSHGHGEEEEEHGDETVGGWPTIERRTRTLGDLLYSFRWENRIDVGRYFKIEPGVSAAYGPNATGETGKTWLFGADLMIEWRNEGAFFRVEGEFLYRYFQANRAEHEGEVFDPTVLTDYGTYVELTGSPVKEFVFGLRLEHASGFRSGEELREEDALRDDRYRISPMFTYRPLEEIHVTLQYNFDYTEHLGGETSHSVWLGLRILFGIHKHIH